GPGELIGELVRGYREAADAEAFAAVEEHFQAAALNETQRRPVETARVQARERLALPDEAAA
ncbi:MAG: hypothetical protein HUU35_19030, partial [Armatimonadetes bacterium]|nr:hypothetical protein [Armatimonadota bacterium]